ncbi:MAG TPA: isochorismatase family protein [Steroidobacteraceae bacterium]|nr:isochorismatase family protein [Steroidobacteraceae bacterium]
MKSALIVIDVQQSFHHRPYWREDGTDTFLARIQKLIDRSQAHGVPVLQVFHEEPVGVFSRTSGLVKAWDNLRISPTDVFYKDVHSALFARNSDGVTLEAWLRFHEIEHVIVTGIRTEQCCETTTRHASDSGFEVTYALDATLTFPMVAKSGRIYTPAEIMERTELVLQDRFAKVVSAEAVAL